MGNISTQLEQYTCSISNYDTKRDYISISHSILSVEEIVDQFMKGFPDNKDIRLKCYKGYQMESDLKSRIKGAFPDRYQDGVEVIALDGLVKGHPDFMFDTFPADCKSVPMDDHLPTGRVPKRVYWQMQGYMLYLNKPKALVIYESRESGKLLDFWLFPDSRVQGEIRDKFILAKARLSYLEKI